MTCSQYLPFAIPLASPPPTPAGYRNRGSRGAARGPRPRHRPRAAPPPPPTMRDLLASTQSMPDLIVHLTLPRSSRVSPGCGSNIGIVTPPTQAGWRCDHNYAQHTEWFLPLNTHDPRMKTDGPMSPHLPLTPLSTPGCICGSRRISSAGVAGQLHFKIQHWGKLALRGSRGALGVPVGDHSHCRLG